MQYTPAQKSRILALRRDYITQLALSSQHRQQLHQELLTSPGASGLSKDELIESHVTVRGITQQLEDCAAHEHKLFMQYTIAVAQGVSSRLLNNKLIAVYWLCQLHLPGHHASQVNCILPVNPTLQA